jgi:hypothetical protein
VAGDLAEQYQNGRGRFWYWRQVLAIVAFEACRKVLRRPLIPARRISLPVAVALVLVIAVLLSVLLSDLWFIGVGVLLGILAGGLKGLKFAYDNNMIESGKKDWIELGPIPVDNYMTSEPLAGSTRKDYREKEPMHMHRGINTTSVASEGFQDLPGLVMMIFFLFGFFSLFVPKDNQWFLVVFLAVEIGAAALYLLANRRERRDSAKLRRTLHEINTPKGN